MEFQFFFRKMDSSEALKQLVRKKVNDQLFKIIGTPSKVRITFFLEGNFQYIHCSVTAKNGMKLYTEASSESMYNAVDQLCQKLGSQLQRYKSRTISRQKRKSLFPKFDLFSDEPSTLSFDENSIDAGDIIKLESSIRPYRERFLN